MKNTHHDTSIDNEWENGELGASEEHVRKVPKEREDAVDESFNLQVISIRLQKELIENLKEISKHEGIGYQPLIRQVLTHYVQDNRRGHNRFHAVG